jgi:hypothetical protein
MLKFVLTLAIVAHGIGHILFLVPLLGIADWGQSSRSWLLGSDTPARLVGSVLWVLAVVGFVSAGIGMIGQQDWWRLVAVIASAVSLVGLLLFWGNPVSSSVLFAGAFDIVVPFTVLVMHWPSRELIGA